MKDVPRLDKSQFCVVPFDRADELDARYWRTKTPLQRLEALEITRQMIYGYDPTRTRLQRILEVVERKPN
jgi:hypothetical protein